MLFNRSVVAASALTCVSSMSWDEAYDGANKILAQMTRDEKETMLRSSHMWQEGYYIAHLPENDRLGIPALKGQDSGNGFRGNKPQSEGKSTCWPSALALSATFDRRIVRASAGALGEEFKAKGANTVLGPGLSVIRNAKGGRNFETLAGEDPYLGAELASEWIPAVQRHGVIATMKHFVFNEQETNRGGNGFQWPIQFNAVVNDKTAWELYYEPFRAGVVAGAGSVMCSYNKVGGVSACGNTKILNDDLKGKMNFRGFVMSDWGATRDMTPYAAGLDVDMQDGPDQVNFSLVSDEVADSAVVRTLAAMQKMGVFKSDQCKPPHCADQMYANVTSEEHNQLARQAATASVVLLKNEAALPLDAEKTDSILLCGSAAIAGQASLASAGDDYMIAGDQYSGGGSGHILAPYTVTPLEAFQREAERLNISVAFTGNDDPVACRRKARTAGPGWSPVGTTIVVCSTSSREEMDRSDLDLDNKCNDLITEAAKDSKTTIVLASIGGAILTPWRDHVDAAAVIFLGGQELGNAYADVVFGHHSPTGHLPVSMPMSYDDTIEPVETDAWYSEGMATGYRNKDFKTAYPFGHGLSYSTFEYSGATQQACKHEGYVTCVSIKVKNTGSREAAVTPQLYLEFPEEAAYPAPVLKGFSKHTIQVGATETITFPLAWRDVSYWEDDKYVMVDSLKAHIGASSADIQTSIPLTITTSSVVV